METAESLPFWTKTFPAYYRTRMSGRIHFAALFLFSGSLAARQRLDIFDLMFQLAQAYLLVFQFRLWDDLASREIDRLYHPDRVLSKIPTVWAFYGLLVLLFALNCASLYGTPDSFLRLGVFLLGNGVLLFWYGYRRGHAEASIVDFHIVLIKYPLIVFLLTNKGRSTPTTLLCAMLVVYFSFCIYEVLHDKKYWTAAKARTIVVWEIAALLAIYVLIAVQSLTQNPALAMTQGILSLVIAGFFTWIFRLRRSFEPAHPWNYVVFVIGFIQLLIFYFGGVA